MRYAHMITSHLHRAMADFGTKTGTNRTVSIGTDADLPAVLESKRNQPSLIRAKAGVPQGIINSFHLRLCAMSSHTGRGYMPAFPPWLERQARRAVLLVWWTVTLQLPRHYALWRRARRLRRLAAEQGVDRNILDIESHGEDNLLVKTGDQVREPRNRRVEITVW